MDRSNDECVIAWFRKQSAPLEDVRRRLGGGTAVSGHQGPLPGKLTHFSLSIGDSVYIATRGGYSQRTHMYEDSFANLKGHDSI